MELLKKDVAQVLTEIRKINKEMGEGRVNLSHELQNKNIKMLTLNNLFLCYLCVFFTVKLFIDGK